MRASSFFVFRHLIFLIAIAFIVLYGTAQAQFTTTTNSDGSLTITGYTGSGGAVTIPGSIGGVPVTSIGGDAFAFSSTLTSVTIPGSITSIGTSTGSGPFVFCSNLTTITVNNAGINNPNYISVDGVLFNSSQTTLIQYPPGNVSTSYTIPGSVISIGESAFDSCTKLTSVTIPPATPAAW